MNKFMRVIGMSLIVGAVGAQAAPVYNCKVMQEMPANANFFYPGGGAPVGDEIVLDLGSTVIDDLTFKSGLSIPLKKTKSKLTLAHKEEGFIQFTGTHQGTLGIYQGRLFGYFDNKVADITVQVLRESLDLGYALHSVYLNCAAQ